MSYEERVAWVQGIIAVVGYAVYLVIVLGRSAQTPLPQTPYVDVLLWTIGAGIVAGIVCGILVGLPGRRSDVRDKQIYRRGDAVGQSFVVIGALAALVLALLEADWFWIANVLYLCFVLSAVLGWIAKAVMYRRGMPAW